MPYHKSIAILQVDFSQSSVAAEELFDIALPRTVRQSSQIYTASHVLNYGKSGLSNTESLKENERPVYDGLKSNITSNQTQLSNERLQTPNAPLSKMAAFKVDAFQETRLWCMMGNHGLWCPGWRDNIVGQH